MDTVKIRLQLLNKSLGAHDGLRQTVVRIFKNEGIRAFWKGNVPAEIMYILYGATQFTSYSMFSKALTELETTYGFNLRPSNHLLIVGTSAGLTSLIVTYPFDLLRTRLAANSKRHFLSMTAVIKQVRASGGLAGLYMGAKPTLLSLGLNSGLMFWTYEIAREVSAQYKDNIPFIEGFCGFFAGASSKGITFPLDTLRKRMQMRSSKTLIIGLARTILRREGLFGFYKGFGISLIKTAPTSAVSLFVYEVVLNGM